MIAEYNKHLHYLLPRIFDKCIRIHATGCLIWNAGSTTGTKKGDAYGLIRLKEPRTMVLAHRVVAACFHGLDLFDEKLRALHACDRSLCCEPEHIYIGTDSHNMQDQHNRNKRVDIVANPEGFNQYKKHPEPVNSGIERKG